MIEETSYPFEPRSRIVPESELLTDEMETWYIHATSAGPQTVLTSRNSGDLLMEYRSSDNKPVLVRLRRVEIARALIRIAERHIAARASHPGDVTQARLL